MSIRESVTYKEVLDTIRTYIINNCANVGSKSLNASAQSNSSSIPVTQTPKTGKVTCKILLTHNIPTNVTTTTLDSQISSFCSSIGLNDTTKNYVIDDENYDAFMKDIYLFLNTKLMYLVPYVPKTTSIGNTTSVTVANSGELKYLVFSTASTITPSQIAAVKPTTNITTKIITCPELATRLSVLCDGIRGAARTVAITATCSISS